MEYKSTNPAVKLLLNNYYGCIQNILEEIVSKDDKLLEIGCGAGESSSRIRSMLSGQYFEVSEYDQRYVTNLKKHRPDLISSQEDVYKMHREPNSFDIVFLLQVLEHLEDFRKALASIARVAKNIL